MKTFTYGTLQQAELGTDVEEKVWPNSSMLDVIKYAMDRVGDNYEKGIVYVMIPHFMPNEGPGPDRKTIFITEHTNDMWSYLLADSSIKAGFTIFEHTSWEEALKYVGDYFDGTEFRYEKK